MTLAKHPFSVCIKDDGEELYLVIEGELDVATAPMLLDCFQNGINSDICLDISCLDFIDTTGLFALVSLQKRARASGSKFTIRFPNKEFLGTLDHMGLTGFFDLRNYDGSRIAAKEGSDSEHPQWISRRF